MNPEIKVAGGGTLEVGKEYEVRHSRKGTFTATIDKIAGEWINVTLTGGKEKLLSKFSIPAQAGDSITIRDVHSYFIPITRDKTSVLKP